MNAIDFTSLVRAGAGRFMGLIDYESTSEKVIEILLYNYRDIIKLHTITSSHTVTFPGMDYE